MKSIVVLFIMSFVLCLTAQGVFAQQFVEDSVQYGAGKVYLTPEYSATFPGGKDRMIDYLKLKFDSYDDGTSDFQSRMIGVIEASFIVETNGKVKIALIGRGISTELDAFMVNALTTMPKWKAAMTDGQAVRSLQTVRYEPLMLYGK